MEVGTKVTVISNTTDHEFEIGSVVECIELQDWGTGIDWGHEFTDGNEDWWMQPCEYTINTTTETGTLAELGVKPGDVVSYTGSGKYTVEAHQTLHSHQTGKSIKYCSWYDAPYFRLISRASDTPAQRYVVVTTTDTVICTRSEVEDLAAGGVDAVYKLGDKVTVTVKVELKDEV